MDNFFHNSDLLDYLVLRPLSHITLNWELDWNSETECYEDEPRSFAALLNTVLSELETTEIPLEYHVNEDAIAQNVLDRLNWSISKKGKRWIGADYSSILEQGAFGDIDQQNLMIAAKGRIEAAKKFGQNHFDDMEEGHRKVLSQLLTIVLFQRADFSDFEDDEE